ncbi:prephenate dehydratase [Burkholderiaceae bacterium]|nr:prephenate dehydratase [Burkholderiaceae bacterium]
MKTLQDLRVEIDQLDTQILTLLNQRAQSAHEVGELKKREGSAVFRPDREAQVISKLQTLNDTSGGLLKSESIGHIWREVMSGCRALEATQRIAYLGPAGTFSQQAALAFFGSSVTEIACPSIDEVFRATAAGTADFGVIPIENSNEGVIARSLDLLLQTPAHIVDELSILVRHHLLRSSNSRDGIQVVLAHPQALAQCQEWLNKHIPDAERRAVSSNAEGARLAKENPEWAAIASDRAGAQYGLHNIGQAIQDDAHNRTRFAIICLPATLEAPTATGRDCTSLAVSVVNQPGALHDLLVPLKNHHVSMTRFESRPARQGQWEYTFFIDLVGHPSEPHMHAVLEELKSRCAFYKVLGTYPQSEA